MTFAGGAGSMRLVGRTLESATVEAMLAESGHRHAALVIEGEPGIGKSTLWLHAVRLAEERGFQLLSCAPAQAEAKLAFASLADLLAPVAPTGLEALPPPQRLALELALLRARPRRDPPDPRAVATATLAVLRHLATAAPVLVAIDDAQWLDGESAAALSFALRRLEPDRPLGVLAAVRTEGGHAIDVLGLGRGGSRVARIRLGPLRAGALHHVLEGELGLALPRPTLQRIATESGGNPLYAVELARALRISGDRPGPGDPLPVPTDLAALLTARMATLPAGARDALLAVALLSHPTGALVERAVAPAVAAEGLEAALRAGVIEVRGEVIRFAHPLYGSAVCAAVLPDRRRALHRRLADVVTDDEERASHLSLATSSPDAAVAETLERAAGLARSRGGWGAAADLLERSHELTPPHRRDDASRRAIAAAQHQLHAGDRPRSRELIEAALQGPLPGSLHAEALRLLAQLSHSDDDVVEAQRLLLDALGHTDDPALAAGIEMDLVYVHASLMDFPGGCRHAYRALELAERVGDPGSVAHALGHCVMMDFLCARGVDWGKVERSIADDDHDGLVPLPQRASSLAALLLLYVGRHEEARERLDALCRVASEAGDESDLAFVLVWRSWLETRSGDFAAAADLAEESAAVATMTGSPALRGWALTQQAYVHAHRGAVDEARRCCAAGVGLVRRSGNLLPNLWIAASLSLVALSQGDAEAAWLASAPLIEPLEQHGIGEPVLPFFLPDALEALIALGELVRADALLSAFEAAAVRLDRIWALATAGRCRGLLLGASGDLPGALVAIERAFDEHERIHLPLERARTLLVRGVLERRSGKRARASASLCAARDELTALGAPLWAARASAELDRIATRRTPTPLGLTPTQERVAGLAGRGQTNREIARALFVTEKTVEANLTRVYRTLGLRSRAELAARITATGSPHEGGKT
jgi:DNA-binding CsgD family transcriptional regulator